MENNVVYRHENKNHRACEIISLDDEYMLRVEGRKNSGKVYFAYFDKNERALEAVKECLQQYSGLEMRPNGLLFVKYENCALTKFRYLSQVLYGAYNPLTKPEDIKKVYYLNGDHTNLRSWNLRMHESTKVEIVDLCGCEYIKISYTTKKGESWFAITDYDHDLFEILRSDYLSYMKNKGMFFLGKWQTQRFQLSQVVVAHKLYESTVRDWKEKTMKFRNDIHKDVELSVDHKKANSTHFGKWDNRYKNLQVITATLNASKGSWTKKLPANCFYIPTETGALYGRHNDAAGVTEVREMTNDPTAAEIDDLRHFCRTGTWNEGEQYNSYALGSKESMDVIIQELSETKFYMEVLNQL